METNSVQAIGGVDKGVVEGKCDGSVGGGARGVEELKGVCEGVVELKRGSNGVEWGVRGLINVKFVYREWESDYYII